MTSIVRYIFVLSVFRGRWVTPASGTHRSPTTYLELLSYTHLVGGIIRGVDLTWRYWLEELVPRESQLIGGASIKGE